MFKIVVGCYEQFVIGYTVSVTLNEDKLFLKSEKQFCDHTHLGCVKCVSSNKTLVVSGSTDETINIFNMKANCDYGPLQGHSGSVNELLMPDDEGNRVVSCGEDGNICVWLIGLKKTGLLKTLRGHKAAASSIALHPSGKLAMSASVKDGTVRTWNMVTGRSCYIKNMKQLHMEFVRWSPSGNYYVLASKHVIQVYELGSAKCIQEIKAPQLIIAIKTLSLIHSVSNDEFVAIGDASGFVSVYSLCSGSLITRFKAHDNRVKDLCAFIPDFFEETLPDEAWLVSVSSDEKIKLWRIDAALLRQRDSDVSAECLLEINASARLTCVTVWKKTEDANQHDMAQDVEAQVNVEKSSERSEDALTNILQRDQEDQAQTIKKLEKTDKKLKKKSSTSKKKKVDSEVVGNDKKVKTGKRKVSFDPDQISKMKKDSEQGERIKRKKKSKPIKSLN